MTTNEFTQLREFDGQRVRLTFSDGDRVIATIVNISTDFDGSQHLVYERVVDGEVKTYYAGGEELLAYEALGKAD